MGLTQHTFSCISDVLCASQNATVATSFSIGISTEQSRPSSNATNGLGPITIGVRVSIRGRFGCIAEFLSDIRLNFFKSLFTTTNKFKINLISHTPYLGICLHSSNLSLTHSHGENGKTNEQVRFVSNLIRCWCLSLDFFFFDDFARKIIIINQQITVFWFRFFEVLRIQI